MTADVGLAIALGALGAAIIIGIIVFTPHWIALLTRAGAVLGRWRR